LEHHKHRLHGKSSLQKVVDAAAEYGITIPTIPTDISSHLSFHGMLGNGNGSDKTDKSATHRTKPSSNKSGTGAFNSWGYNLTGSFPGSGSGSDRGVKVCNKIVPMALGGDLYSAKNDQEHDHEQQAGSLNASASVATISTAVTELYNHIVTTDENQQIEMYKCNTLGSIEADLFPSSEVPPSDTTATSLGICKESSNIP
jgi:hypothetical protein